VPRLLLLVNYRPDYRHGWGSKTYYTQVRLDPLPPASADVFLQALVGDDPSLAPLTHLLIQRTEGNPFFLEESVQTLVETGWPRWLLGEAWTRSNAWPTMLYGVKCGTRPWYTAGRRGEGPGTLGPPRGCGILRTGAQRPRASAGDT
jgi:hypothetical protein